MTNHTKANGGSGPWIHLMQTLPLVYSSREYLVCWKRENVRRTIFMTILGIELLHARILNERNDHSPIR